MSSRRFDLIAFDWDGTLSDSTAHIVHSLRAAAADVGVAVPSREACAYVIGLGLQQALRHCMPGLEPARYPQLTERYRHHYFAGHETLALFDGSLYMLQALKARQHWLAVATGKARRGLDIALAQMGLGPLFDASRTADETASKPDPRMLRELMAEFGAAPARTLMIGDTIHDLQMAANAGVAAVGVSFGAHEHEALLECKPLFIAHSTAELHDWLLRHG